MCNLKEIKVEVTQSYIERSHTEVTYEVQQEATQPTEVTQAPGSSRDKVTQGGGASSKPEVTHRVQREPEVTLTTEVTQCTYHKPRSRADHNTKGILNRRKGIEIEDKTNSDEDRRYTEKKIEDKNGVKIEDRIRPSIAAMNMQKKMNIEPSAAAKIGKLVQSKICASGSLVKSTIAGTCKKSRGPFKKRQRGGGLLKNLNFGHSDPTRSDQPNNNLTILTCFKPVPIVSSPEEGLINQN